MDCFELTAFDTELGTRVGLGFFGSRELAGQVANSYRNGTEPYRDYAIEPAVVEDGEPVLES